MITRVVSPEKIKRKWIRQSWRNSGSPIILLVDIVAALIQLLLTPFTALASAAAYRQGNGEALAA